MEESNKFEFKIKLGGTEDAVYINKMAEKYDVDIDVKSNDSHYIVDAKSLMGILCLDLTKPVIVSINDSENRKKIKNDIVKYVVKWKENINMENITVEDCLKMYQSGMTVIINNGEVIGFKEENCWYKICLFYLVNHVVVKQLFKKNL